MVQFLSQLLFIPQGTLFGQLMFVATLGASWLYNSMLSSINRKEIQTDILFDILKIGPDDVRKYTFNNWTESVVFTSLVLASANHIKAPRALLNGMLPNDTLVWNAWKSAMTDELNKKELFHEEIGTGFNFPHVNNTLTDEDDRALLQTFFDDAHAAWRAWNKVREDINTMRGCMDNGA
ncbi:hypothetical protein BD311DRAFT_765737 [Dichomitus squalens]|uniref:Uncharacterized protein n=1 Tax=Dichomitus squalens TaxID=114155 RepID=A0A4Q9MC81_9APHY|nr:hypothetical protein BD311DRAFT_765737 [Dichomitus squalens]